MRVLFLPALSVFCFHFHSWLLVVYVQTKLCANHNLPVLHVLANCALNMKYGGGGIGRREYTSQCFLGIIFGQSYCQTGNYFFIF